MSPGDDPSARAALALAVAGVASSEGARPRLRHRRVGDAYAADAWVDGAVVALASSATLRFDWVSVADAGFLEFEPGVLPGWYCIDQVSIQGRPLEGLLARVMRTREQGGGDRRGGPWIGSESRRPLLELDVRGAFETGPVRVDVVVRRQDPALDNARALLSVHTELSAQADRLARDAARTAHAQGGTLRSVAPALEAMEARLVERLLERSGVADSASAQRLAALEHGLGQRFDELTAQLSLLGTLPAHVDRATAPLQHLLDRVGDLQAASGAWAVSQAETHAAVLARLERLEHGLRQVRLGVENVFWRRWLRRIRGAAR